MNIFIDIVLTLNTFFFFNIKVLNFLNQQTKGMLNSDTKLIDALNISGETPLLRACTIGKISVVKALLDQSSDPFVQDKFGNTVFINCSKNSLLWCLHFIYEYIKAKYGTAMIKALDWNDF